MEGYAGTEVLFLSKQDVDRLLTYPDTVNAVERAFLSDGNGQMCVPKKGFIHTGEKSLLFPMAACLYDLGVAGVKWTNFYPQSPKGLPTCWSHVLVLSRIEDGQPFAILDATSITSYRTAGGHAVVAARHLAKPDSKVLGIMGCGVQGMSAIRSFTQHFDLEKIKIFTSKRSEEACRPVLEKEISVPVQFCDTPAEMARDCDIIVTATTSPTPLLTADMVPPGCLVTAMYAFRDLDPALSRLADKWVLGQRDSDTEEILEAPFYEAGQLNEHDVYASLGEIVSGKKPGRENAQERIVFTHMGMGSLDIAVADSLVKKALELGYGQRLKLN